MKKTTKSTKPKAKKAPVKAITKTASDNTKKTQAVLIHKDTKIYNKALLKADKQICDMLAEEIAAAFSKSKNIENKIWHGSPVWFSDGNPIVGYDKLKNYVRLLFWSGQSFDEAGLIDEGSFKASEARYTEVSQINKKDLKRWLKKSVEIQWDYKNIRKMNGKLTMLK